MPCDGESKQNSEKTATGEPAKPLKPCCACPETRKKRDEWYV